MHASTVSGRRPWSIYLLASLLGLQSFTALICGAAMICDPSGASMQLPQAVLAHAAFNNFLIPGIFLFSCLGLLPIWAIVQLLKGQPSVISRRWNIYRNYSAGWMLSLFCGFATLIWITAQLYVTQTYHILQTVYSTVGMLLLIIALLPATMRYCRLPDARLIQD